MAPPSHPLAKCQAGSLAGERRPLRVKAQPGEGRAKQVFFFFFKSHEAKPLYGKKHAAWTSTFKQEVTSLTNLAIMEPTGLDLNLEPVLYSPCLYSVPPLPPCRPCLSHISEPPSRSPTHGGGAGPALPPALLAWACSTAADPAGCAPGLVASGAFTN